MSFKARKGMLYIFIRWCFFFISSYMVEGDESSRVMMAN